MAPPAAVEPVSWPQACAAAVATLPVCGPGRIAALLDTWGPEQAWANVVDGSATRHPDVARACGRDPGDVGRAWAHAAATIDPAHVGERCARLGLRVGVLGDDAYPPPLAADLAAPRVVFWRGDPAVLDGPRAAIVGTRRATSYGRQVAAMFGSALAAQGVRVVSGLAAGIDAAAHAGALERARCDPGAGPPVGVVGSGHDVCYPPANRWLWAEVGERGLLVSEAPPGATPQPWRFPARNRIIAALAEAVLVVESGLAGGSLLTVKEADRRGRTVLAVPGPVTSERSHGTNALLADGAVTACGPEDVLVALGFRAARRPAPADPRRRPAPHDVALVEAVTEQARSAERLAALTGRALPDVVVALERLADAGWVDERGGWWFALVDHPGAP